MKIGGLDIGTTGCKLVVFDENGNYLGKAYRDYPVHRTNSAHEVDISSVMDAVFAVFREMTAQYDDIAGVGVSSFGESFVCADAEGRPLHPAMLYTDPRGEEELRELGETVGNDRIAQITGLIPHTMYSISKLMWLKKHQPEIYAQAKMVLLMEDYVVYHLTGRRQIDYTLATRTMAFDIRTIGWSSEILDAAGIDYDRKKFEPHITIVRRSSGRWQGAAAPKGEMMVRKVSLMKSEEKGGKRVYTELFSV